MHYRGVTYEDTSKSIETQESDIVAHYRGACWKLREAKRGTTVKHDGPRLKYRGNWTN